MRQGRISACLTALACLATAVDGFSVPLPSSQQALSATLTTAGARHVSLRSAGVQLRPGVSQRASVLSPRMAAAGGDDEVDMDAFRSMLSDQWDKEVVAVEEDDGLLDGYKLRDLIVAKWGVPYDIKIERGVFLGKPLLFLNVMWKHFGQQSFHLTEQEYLEHLQFIAELLNKWERVDHVKKVISECKKRPAGYFGYAVPIPLDLPGDIMDGLGGDYTEGSSGVGGDGGYGDLA